MQICDGQVVFAIFRVQCETRVVLEVIVKGGLFLIQVVSRDELWFLS